MIKIKNLGNRGEIYIHGLIIDDTDAKWLEMDGGTIGYVFPAQVRSELEALRGLPVDVHIASDGGNVAAGVALYNMLAAHDAPVVVYIDAWAASIASYLAFVGQKIVMPENTFLMIHNPAGGAYGGSDYLRSVAEYLDKLRDMLADKYAENSKLSVEKMKELMDDETWFTAREALETFGDKVEIVQSNDLKAVACYSTFKSAPEAVLKPAGINTQADPAPSAVDKNTVKYVVNILNRAWR